MTFNLPRIDLATWMQRSTSTFILPDGAGYPGLASETLDCRDTLLRDQKCLRNPLIQRGENRSIRTRQLKQMPVRRLSRALSPLG